MVVDLLPYMHKKILELTNSRLHAHSLQIGWSRT
jgi:hypothetical protein